MESEIDPKPLINTQEMDISENKLNYTNNSYKSQMMNTLNLFFNI